MAEHDLPSTTRAAGGPPPVPRSLDPNRTAASGTPPEADGGAVGIPGYVILSELGQGGMGVVYRARHSALNREVALKTILRTDASEADLKRFWAEAEVMAAVKHPNVVQVFDFGDHAGRPYMAMELVSGGALSGLIAEGALSPAEAAELLERIARGVAAAHDLGVVHRDLKPGNVLLDADGTPKVADFGLAKWHSVNLTRTQTLMGTPSYMAPEQAAGRAKFVGPQVDVWALGVILYEMLTGARPFVGESVHAVLIDIQMTDPEAPRAITRGLSRDLDTIVMKCLTKEPTGRYPTAGELADDLARFLAGEPIEARPVGRAERLVRWARRKPTAAAAYALLAVAAALALVVVAVGGLWREAERAKGTAEAATRRADDARGKVEDLLGVEQGLRGALQGANGDLRAALDRERAAKEREARANDRLARFNYGQTIQAAYQAWRDNKIAEAREDLSQTRPDLRGWEYDYVHRLCHADLVTLSHVDQEERGFRNAPLAHAVWSPDGQKVLTGDASVARLWNAATGTLAHEFAVAFSEPTGVAFSPDGARFFASAKDGPFVRDTATGRPLVRLKGRGSGYASVVWSPDGNRLLTWGDRLLPDSTASVWDAATGALVVEIKGIARRINTGAFSPDGARVLFSADGQTAAWDAVTGKLVVEFPGKLPGEFAAWSPDGSKVVGGSRSGVTVWDATGRPLVTLAPHPGGVTRAAFSPDGARVVTACADGAARVCDATTGQLVTELRGHTAGLVAVSYSRDGQRIVTASKDGSARVWTAAGALVTELKGHEKALTGAAFSPDGTRVLTAGGADKTARVWDAARNPAHDDYTGRGAVNAAAWSPDGAHLALATFRDPVRILDAGTGRKRAELAVVGVDLNWHPDGGLLFVVAPLEPPTVWDATSGKRRARLDHPKGNPINSVWSADGSKLLTTANDAAPRLWDARTGKVLVTMDRGKDTFNTQEAAFSPDGARVFGGTARDGRVWDVPTGARLAEFTGHTMPIAVARWSPDGARVLTGARDVSTRIWDAATGRQEVLIAGPHLSTVTHALWSADGGRVVLAGTAMPPRVCDARTGEVLVEFGAYRSEVTSLGWLGGQSRVVTTARDDTLRVWDPTSGAELLSLPAHEAPPTRAVAHVSPDGTRVVTRGAAEGVAVVYDARPLNRARVRLPVAPPPRPAAR